MKQKKQNSNRGFSLIELLVVILIFSILGVLSTQSLALSLRGSRKSESLGEVRENVDYALNVMQRLLRTAKSITTCSDNQLEYFDENGQAGRFSCLPMGSSTGYIASGSADLRLTNPNVNIDCTGAVFSCPAPTSPAPPSVVISVRAVDANSSGAESAQVTMTSKVLLRAY